MSAKPQLLIFDVNETLLNMEPVKVAITKALKSPFAFKQWFSWLLHYSLVDTVTQSYHTFSEIGQATLKMTAASLNTSIDEEEITHIVQLMQQLEPYPEVVKALDILQQAGYRMATLTNSTAEALQKQLAFAEIASYFERNLSIDGLNVYKPHPETYQAALKELNTAPADSMLIAAHGWDVAGALHAGLQAAFVEREGQALYPLSPPPHLIGKDLLTIAQDLAEL
ncbi:haloacid dehalogenase type II [Mucilaginibacter robiniae]|uniref:Haloacid dehalogenase type II n=1 Tax=Mucilaginibacter robiniae TaxID=2728022 RepID=A0A7L5DV53_9SPHI|nr:haloacid dehalogenase type II [Mucilaginibacter robiniae]QJD94995.1 haloacid dehalogenase type II [Mucilaginibacter robiniae]